MRSAVRPTLGAPAPREPARRSARDRTGHHIHGTVKVSSTRRLQPIGNRLSVGPVPSRTPPAWSQPLNQQGSSIEETDSAGPAGLPSTVIHGDTAPDVVVAEQPADVRPLSRVCGPAERRGRLREDAIAPIKAVLLPATLVGVVAVELSGDVSGPVVVI